MSKVKVEIIPLREGISVPSKGTDEAAGFDICADIRARDITVRTINNVKYNASVANSFIIEPGARALIPIGFIFVIPPGYSIRLHPRSGNAWKFGIGLMNGEGIIDSDYPNETFVMLHNTTRLPYTLNHGDRIAQCEIVKTVDIKFKALPIGTEFNSVSNRTGGFGSTGK